MAVLFPQTLRSLESDRFAMTHLALASAAACLLAWSAWALAARVTLYETSTRARIEARGAVHPVQARVGGRVLALRAALGAHVAAGDVLLELDAAAPRLEVDEARAHHASLRAQHATIVAELARLERATRAAGSAGVAAVREAAAHLREARAAARLARQQLRRARRLSAGHLVAEQDVQQTEAAAAQRREQIAALEQSVARLRWTERGTADERGAQLEALRRQGLAVSGQIAELDATIRRLEDALERCVVRAPVAGRIGELAAAVRPGAVLAEGDRIAQVIPDDGLHVVAEVAPGAALGRVREGQHAWLRLDGFPWTQYGAVGAIVRRVGGEVREGLVRVELDLDPDRASRAPLEHGLPGALEIEVERVAPAALLLRAAGRLVTPPSDRAAAESAERAR